MTIATGLHGWPRPACAWQPLQVHSPRARQATRTERRPTPGGRGAQGGAQRPEPGLRVRRASREAEFRDQRGARHVRRPPGTPPPSSPPRGRGKIIPEPARRGPRPTSVPSPTAPRPVPARRRERRLPPRPLRVRVASPRSLRPACPIPEGGDSGDPGDADSPAAFVHSHLPACPPPPFPDAGG